MPGATYNVSANELGVRSKVQTAGQVDITTFANDVDQLEVLVTGADLLVSVDGSDPSTAPQRAYPVPAGTVRVIAVPSAGGTVVKTYSAAAAVFSLTDLGR